MKRKIEQKTTPRMVWIRADKKRQGENSPESEIGINDRTPRGGVIKTPQQCGEIDKRVGNTG